MNKDQLAKRFDKSLIGQLGGAIPPEGYLTLTEAAVQMKLDSARLQYFVFQRKEIETIKVGRLRFVHPQTIKNWFADNPERAWKLRMFGA